MWPWEHVVVGYVAFSLTSHLWRRGPPRSAEAGTVVVASLLPDLVDKPLAWSFDLVVSGYGPAHSVFVALPAVVAVATASLLAGRRWVGVSFAVSYLLHLVGDILHNATGSGSIAPEILIWPVRVYAPGSPRVGVIQETLLRVNRFRAEVIAGDLTLYTRVQLALMAIAVVLWVYDGTPPFPESVRRTRDFVVEGP